MDVLSKARSFTFGLKFRGYNVTLTRLLEARIYPDAEVQSSECLWQ
jgi:hypothetical protein